jgi:hypothetical protein
MVLVGGLILLGSLLGGDFDAGSRGARMPSFSESSYLGRGLMYLGYAVAAIAGLVALWPANRCPVCGSRRCRCYDRAR